MKLSMVSRNRRRANKRRDNLFFRFINPKRETTVSAAAIRQIYGAT